ncbi:sensor histidine kinase [Halobellus sp. EA9]|uniref:sensor histidine kinase n=1 Tax=Halobellus sp. EA9 TaxID=3421647 RepID=UPI003EBE56D8
MPGVPDRDLGSLRTVAGLGAAFVLVAAIEVVALLSRGGPLPDGFLVGVVTSLPFAVGPVYGSYRLAASTVSERRYGRIVRWTLGGGAIFLLINVGLMVALPPDLVIVALGWARWALAIGAGVGFLVGVFEARAIERELAAERIRLKQEELQRERDRLEEFAGVVSHDLRNPLNVASGHVTLLEQKRRPDCDGCEDHIEAIRSSLDRMETIIDDTLTLAREGRTVGETSRVELASVATESWGAVDTADAELAVETDAAVRADPDRLRHVFENLFRNSIEHAGDDVTVRVGALEDGSGFFVADDGSGIPEGDRDRVLEAGYTSRDSGSGLGLAIVEQIAGAHGWTVTVAESDGGGARFEFRGVDSA